MDRYAERVDQRSVKITLFSVGALCIAFGAYRWYGLWAVPIALILVGLAAWENLREK